MTFALHLPHRRPHCPPAPPLPVRTGPVCHWPVFDHAVSDDAKLAAGAELLLARLSGNTDLIAALRMRLAMCPSAGPAEVTS